MVTTGNWPCSDWTQQHVADPGTSATPRAPASPTSIDLLSAFAHNATLLVTIRHCSALMFAVAFVCVSVCDDLTFVILHLKTSFFCLSTCIFGTLGRVRISRSLSQGQGQEEKRASADGQVTLLRAFFKIPDCRT